MKDEIKEISITFPGQILDYVDTKEHLLELFNYITNLQEENENKDNKILELQQELLNKKLNIKDIEYKEKMIYKSRNKKAIKFVEENPWGIGYGEVSYLLDILQGDGEE